MEKAGPGQVIDSREASAIKVITVSVALIQILNDIKLEAFEFSPCSMDLCLSHPCGRSDTRSRISLAASALAGASDTRVVVRRRMFFVFVHETQAFRMLYRI